MIHENLLEELSALRSDKLCNFAIYYIKNNMNLVDKFELEFNLNVKQHIEYMLYIARSYKSDEKILSSEFMLSIGDGFGELFIDSDRFTSVTTYFVNNLLAMGHIAILGLARGELIEKERLVLEHYPVDIEWAKISQDTDEILYGDKDDSDFCNAIEGNLFYRTNMNYLIRKAISFKD